MDNAEKLLSKADILGFDDTRYAYVMVPEWGGRVRLRTMTGTERDDFELSLLVAKKEGKKTTREVVLRNVRAKLVATCICDEQGKRLFNDTEIATLGAKNGKALDRIYEISRDLNGLSEEEVEEIVKNSVSGQSDNTTSD
jgi:hypothetical protein